MEENIFLFAQNGGLFAIMFSLFLIGFIIKVMVSLIYDKAIEKAIVFQESEKSPVWNIIEKYKTQFNETELCKNTKAYVDNELHNWKVCGIFVERLNDIGNLIVGLGIFVCVIFDMILLIGKTTENVDVNLYMRYIYFYSMMSVIMLIVIKGWETFINIANKKDILSDKIVNYLDNNCGGNEYVMIKTNVYIEKGNLDNKNNTEKNIEKDTEIYMADNKKKGTKDNTGKSLESSIIYKDDKIQSEENVINEDDIKESNVFENKPENLQKKDKEKVIEQVLEEFLV